MISTIYNFNEFEGKMSSSVVYFSLPHSVLVLLCDFYHVPSLQEREREREREGGKRKREEGWRRERERVGGREGEGRERGREGGREERGRSEESGE